MSLLTRFNDNVAAIIALKDHSAVDRISAMRKYTGWGGFSTFFGNPDMSERIDELKAIVTPDEWESLTMGVLDAYYTPAPICQAIAGIMERSGLDHNHTVLDSAFGLGAMTAPLMGKTNILAIEKDLITAAISKEVFADTEDFTLTQGGFERHLAPEGFYSASIINPPYGEVTLFDPMSAELSSHPIHQYFLMKSCNLIAEGGLLVALVSSSFMDSPSSKASDARLHLSKHMELLDGYRLPSSTFAETGTQVITDLLFFRKLTASDKAARQGKTKTFTPFAATQTVRIKYQSNQVNEFFAANPEKVLGEMSFSHGKYGRMTTNITGSLDDAITSIEAAKLSFSFTPKAYVESGDDGLVSQSEVGFEAENRPALFQYAYSEKLGVYVQRITENRYSLCPNITKGSAKEKRLLAAVALATQLEEVRILESGFYSDIDLLEEKRLALNAQYDAFVKKFGAINNTANRFLVDDNTLLPLFGLEVNYQPKVSEKQAERQNCEPCEESWDKALILTERVYFPYKIHQYAMSPKQALVLSIMNRGCADFEYMTSHSPFNEEQLIDSLAGDLIFFNPETGAFDLRDEYLSGNIRHKLNVAQANTLLFGLEKNIAELEKVLPVPVEPQQLDVPFMASWVPLEVVEEFVQHITGSRFNEVTKAFGGFLGEIKYSNHEANTKFGTTSLDCAAILHCLLNKKAIRVVIRHSDGSSTVDQSATLAAQAKGDAIVREWKSFVRASAERLQQLTDLFNDTINCFSIKQYDGSHLTIKPGIFEGQSLTFQYRTHQINAVWANLCMRGGLMAHVVGSGKTATAIAAAYIGVNSGIYTNPIFAVPNNVLTQFYAEFKRIFPNSRVLLIDDANKGSDSATRRRMLARVGMNSWHGVIMSHETFTSIDAPEDGLAEVMFEIKQEAYSPEAKGTERHIARRKQSIITKAEKNLEKAMRKRGYGFEHLNSNMLFVDEADLFKNLQFMTASETVKGLGNPEGSGKAFDLLTKIRHINAKHNRGCKGVALMTGTAISNSVAETYTLARYLAKDELDRQGLTSFDGFISCYSVPTTEYEITATGSFKAQTRFRDFTNLIQMNAFFRSFSDTVDKKYLVDFYEAQGDIWPEPKMKNGKPFDLVLDGGDEFSLYNDHLVYRAENFGKVAGYENDNMLAVISASASATMDMRLAKDADEAGVCLEDYESPKTQAVAHNVLDVYHRVMPNERATQLVFIDVGTPKQHSSEVELLEFSVYHDLKQILINGGINPEEIAFVHDAANTKQRAALFEKMRNGTIRVLMGSTPKLGAGTNVQDRLVALHSVTCSWRPREFQQQLGRIVRQGNLFFNRSLEAYKNGEITKDQLFEVEVYRYAVSMSLDAMQIQANELKARFISTFLSRDTKIENKLSLRDADAIDYSEFKARVSGKPELLMKVKNDGVLRQLFALEDDYTRSTSWVKQRQTKLPQAIKQQEGKIADLTENLWCVEAFETLQTNLKEVIAEHLCKGSSVEKFKTIGGIVGNAMRQIKDNFYDYKNFQGAIAQYNDTAINVSCSSFGKVDTVTIVHGDSEIDLLDLPGFDAIPTEQAQWTANINKLFGLSQRLEEEKARLERLRSDLAYYASKEVAEFAYTEELERAKEIDRILTLAIESEESVIDGVNVSEIVLLDLESIMSKDAQDSSNQVAASVVIEATAFGSVTLLDDATPQADSKPNESTEPKENKVVSIADGKAKQAEVLPVVELEQVIDFEIDARGQLGFGF